MWLVGIGIILLYNLLIFYIGYNVWTWLKTISSDRKSIKYIFWFVLVLFAYSFILARWVNDSLVLSWIGAIWLSLFYFFVLLLPLANIAVFLRRFTRISKEKFVKGTGYTISILMVCLFFYGMYNAYSPV